MMARVLGVMSVATEAGSIVSVAGLTSAKTGVPPWYKTQLALAAKVRGERYDEAGMRTLNG